MNTKYGSSGSNKIIKLPNNLEFHVPSREMRISAWFLIWEIFKLQRYNIKGFEIKSTDTIIDIGANMGLFVMWASPQASKGKIIAIEPTESIDILALNLQKNNLNNVKIIKAAIGLDEKHIDLITYPGFNVINHQIDQKPTLCTRILVKLLTSQLKFKKVTKRVNTISLDRIIDDNNLSKIDLLKIDGEGCEYEIFRNLSNKHFDKIEKIIMEFHEYHPDNKHQELISILKFKGYEVNLVKPFFDYYLVGKCGFIWAKRNK
ncbi:FkbM family methyltransferase [Candidatus Desantisbacteria bacterium]|nr:FkbM family methyltransferase [Candidatus Desantisbacteria bacterium]